MSVGRRVRGLVATSLVWALAWTPFGVASAFNLWYELGTHLSKALSWPPLDFLAMSVAVWAVWGAINGALFAIVLTTRARSRALEDLSGRRTAIWGALVALTLPGLMVGSHVVEDGFAGLELAIPTLVLAAALGGGLAAGTLALARRDTGQMRKEGRASVISEAAT